MDKFLVGFFASINNDIYNLYKNAGYSTMYMHGNVGDFWNRKSVYGRLAVDEMSFIDAFDDTSEMIGGFLSDELFYRQAVSKLNDKNEPFMAFLVAASSHVPYYLEGIHDKEEKISIDIGKYEDTQFGYYLEAVNYADYAFGVLIDELKLSGLYDDSVILVFGDHYGLNMFDENLMEFASEVNPNYNIVTSRNNYENVLCGLKVPGIQNRKIDSPVSKLDIKPTLLELSGIDDDLSLGFTMFSTKDYAFINNGYAVTDKYYYVNGTWYYRNSGAMVRFSDLHSEEMQTLLEYEANVVKELDISSSIVINNLLLK